MGNVLYLASETADVGVIPRPFDLALEEGPFRRDAFLRGPSGRAADREAFTEGRLALDALRRLERWEQAERARRAAEAGLPLDASDLVFLRAARLPRIRQARIRTAFGPASAAWNASLRGPLSGEDSWRDIPEGESRSWVHRVLGPVAVRPDGTVVRPGHASSEGTPRSFEARFSPKEIAIELFFLPPEAHPDWRALLAHIEANPDQRYRLAPR